MDSFEYPAKCPNCGADDDVAFDTGKVARLSKVGRPAGKAVKVVYCAECDHVIRGIPKP